MLAGICLSMIFWKRLSLSMADSIGWDYLMEPRAMAWIVGIDEAGYGPNLGPLVMTAVACRVPDDVVNVDLWRLLRQGVRRHGQRDDGRPLVADSKLVYSPSRGLAQLEKTVLAALDVRPTRFDEVEP